MAKCSVYFSLQAGIHAEEATVARYHIHKLSTQAPASRPPPLVSTPPLAKPEKFDGDPAKCQGFL